MAGRFVDVAPGTMSEHLFLPVPVCDNVDMIGTSNDPVLCVVVWPRDFHG